MGNTCLPEIFLRLFKLFSILPIQHRFCTMSLRLFPNSNSFCLKFPMNLMFASDLLFLEGVAIIFFIGTRRYSYDTPICRSAVMV